MKSNLDLLLDHYKAEESWLKTQLNQCTQEWDYIQAQAYANTLADVQHKLWILNQLAVPLTEEIKRAEKSLDYWQNKIQRSKAEGIPENLIEQFFGYPLGLGQQKLLDLQEQQKKKRFFTDAEQLDEALEYLLLNRYLRLCIKEEKEEDSVLELYCSPDNCLNIIYLKELPNDEDNDFGQEWSTLKNLGFSWQDNFLTLSIPISTTKNFIQLKMILAQLLFDVAQIRPGKQMMLVFEF